MPRRNRRTKLWLRLYHPGWLNRYSGWFRRIHSLRHYSKRALVADLLAGLTVGHGRRAPGDGLRQDRRAAAAIRSLHGHRDDCRRGAVRLVEATDQRPDQRDLHRLSSVRWSGSATPEQIQAAVLLAFLVGAIQLGITLLRLGRPHPVHLARGDRRLHVGAARSARPRPAQEPARLMLCGEPDDHFLNALLAHADDRRRHPAMAGPRPIGVEHHRRGGGAALAARA